MAVPLPLISLLSLAPLMLSLDPLQPLPPSTLPADLQPLLVELRRHGFQLRIAPPPVRSAQGLYEGRTRTLWLAPITFEEGIARSVFLHEAVHAVQSCPSGKPSPLGWRLPLQPVVDSSIRYILSTNYHPYTRAVEQEAFAAQSQPDVVPRLRAALKQRCRLGPAAQHR